MSSSSSYRSSTVTDVAPWVHLTVASSYSLQYGTASPQALVDRIAEDGQPFAGLTDRDGLHGATQWALACQEAGIGAVLGVDLAVAGTAGPASSRTPARGGAWIDESADRITLLAHGSKGWSSLCRIVSAAHAGERRAPMLDPQSLATHADGLVLLLGPHSDVTRHLLRRRPDLAEAALHRWQQLVGSSLRIAVANHRMPPGHPTSTSAAARMLRWAAEQRIPSVLVNEVRMLDAQQARIADVLDASRLLVPLGSSRLVPSNGENRLKSSAELAEAADEACHAAGLDPRRLRERTLALAEQCVLDPERDLGIGEVFVPELDVLLGEPTTVAQAHALLRSRCEEVIPARYEARDRKEVRERLEAELRTIEQLRFAGYFLTVAEVVSMVKGMGIRVAARGSGAGSLVNHLLGISGVDPIRHGLLMERFLSPLRRALPDIDIDVESARRLEVYDAIVGRFGTERVACVSMMEKYRVRHAIRDVGAALAMPPVEVDALAKAFPHIRARDARAALADLPELRASGLGRMAARGELDGFLSLVEGLDRLPRHIAMHPCGVLLSDASLLDRTPVQMSAQGYPMSQFDKDDVETMGLLKLDVLGVRMQSSIAYALQESERVTGERIDLDDRSLDDPDTYALVQSTRTLGCFQIESPGQRELVGKFAPETFNDLIIDISLFRPGPVKSDMVTPFLKARQGWAEPQVIHESLRSALEETCGVVVFHEQVLRVIATMTGCSLAEADECRRAMNTPAGIDEVRTWFYPAALRSGYRLDVVERVWDVLRSFASFGFCKAHAAAFALPTYQSAWLKAHHPAAFFAGILTHDPGMYPKRLILDDARHFGVAVLGLDVNRSDLSYRLEPVESASSGFGLRIPLTEVRGMSAAEADSIVEGRPYSDLPDLWHRSAVSRPVAESLVLAGAFDAIYGFRAGVRDRERLTRRDLLLQLGDLDRQGKGRGAGLGQLSLGLAEADPSFAAPSGLPEMDASEMVRAELEVLGLDVTRHVVDFYRPMLAEIGTVDATALLGCRSQQEILVAGVKVATQSPPIRSGKRVIFLTLDDGTGPLDATFFEDALERYADSIFGSWLLLVRGHVRRTGPRGVSLRATGAWELGEVRTRWLGEGPAGVLDLIEETRLIAGGEGRRERVLVHSSGFRQSPYADVQVAGSVNAPSKLWHTSPGSSGW